SGNAERSRAFSKGRFLAPSILVGARQRGHSDVPESALEKHLAAIGADPQTGHEAGIVLRHVQAPALRRRARAVDAVSILAPQRPVEVEVRAEGHVERYRLRKGDIALAPPLFESDAKIGAFDGVIGWVKRPLIAAAAEAIDPALAGEIAFRRAPQARDLLLSSLAFELCDEIEQGAPSGRLYLEALATAFLVRIVRRYVLRPTEARSWGKTTEDARVRRTIAFIEARLADDVGLPETARHVGLSATQLADIFKAATGERIPAFVRRRRL